MSEADQSEVDQHRQALAEPASTLYAAQKVYGEQVRAETRQCYGRLQDAHLLIAGVLASALLRINGKIVPTTDLAEQRSSLLASFVIGVDLCERAIEEGRYLQASALVRQELETLAQLHAVAAGRRKEHRSPNMASVTPDLGRLYGDLSAAAHLSKHSLVRSVSEYEMPPGELPGPTDGTRYFPALDRDLARRLFAVHLIVLVRVIEEMGVDLEERYERECLTTEEMRALNVAVGLMASEGVVEIG